jgi:hypothetical protein
MAQSSCSFARARAKRSALCVVATSVFLLSDDSSSPSSPLPSLQHDDVGWLKTVDEYYSGTNNTIQHAGVRYIISSVIEQLEQNPNRTFTYVEQAFFQRWWREQSDETQAKTKQLVANKQLSFVNGGWCSTFLCRCKPLLLTSKEQHPIADPPPMPHAPCSHFSSFISDAITHSAR